MYGKRPGFLMPGYGGYNSSGTRSPAGPTTGRSGQSIVNATRLGLPGGVTVKQNRASSAGKRNKKRKK